MKTKQLRILALVIAVCLVMHITTVKAQTTAPFTITHSNGGSFEFRADGKFVATGNNRTFSWNPSLGSLSYGYYSTASGSFSMASGYSTSATGSYSTASGYSNSASGYASTASGYLTGASGSFSIALGARTSASGYASTASGFYSQAPGKFSTASGAFTEATSMHSSAVGVLNVGGGNPTQWVPTDPLFEIGNGGNWGYGNPAINERSTAFVVYKNGNASLQGTLEVAPGGDIPMFNPAP